MDNDILTYFKVIGMERFLAAIRSEYHGPLQESTLGFSRINNFGLSHHDRLVLQVVEDSYSVQAVVLKSTLHNTFFEISIESQHLFIKFDVGGFELFLDISTIVIWHNGLAEALARFHFLRLQI